jgi:hypothetical protein
MALEDRDYMRDVPEYRRGVGLPQADAGGRGSGGRKPPTAWADPPPRPPWWRNLSRPQSRRRTRTRPWAWFLLGVIATLAAVALVLSKVDTTENTPRAAASLALSAPGRSTNLPHQTVAVVDGIPVVGKPLHISIAGRTGIRAGTVVRIHGRTPLGRGGPVILKVRHNDSGWVTAGRYEASPNGSYEVRLQFTLLGRTQIRIAFPGGSFAYKWYRVS